MKKLLDDSKVQARYKAKDRQIKQNEILSSGLRTPNSTIPQRISSTRRAREYGNQSNMYNFALFGVPSQSTTVTPKPFGGLDFNDLSKSNENAMNMTNMSNKNGFV